MYNENPIVLEFYNPIHSKEIESFHLPKDQEKFTALPKDMLEASEVRHPIVILADHKPIGFFVLHSSSRVKEYTDNPTAMLLTAFSINFAEQGKGYAKRAMKLLKPFVNERFSWCNEIVLAVNHKNIPAQNLYKRVGFFDTGNRKIGPIGEQYVYNLSIK